MAAIGSSTGSNSASDPTATVPRALLGFVLGVMTKRGSIGGYYHAIMFPLILVEMANGEWALLGALDCCCLCCVCAGVVAAVGATAKRATERGACRRAACINLGLGDYVEACYPYMERSLCVHLAASESQRERLEQARTSTRTHSA